MTYTNEVWNHLSVSEKYMVSNMGRVRVIKSRVHSYVGRILPEIKNNCGYFRVQLFYGGKRHFRTIHSLVAEAFLGARPNGFQINHKDGDKTNNKVSNLEYVTSSGNMLHAIKLGKQLGCVGENNPLAKLNSKQIKEIRSLYKGKRKGPTMEAIAKKYNTTFSNISLIINNKNWRHI